MTKWQEWNIDWSSIDLVLAGTPCQSVSIVQSKTRKKLNGKSKLFFTAVDVLNYVKQFNPNIKFIFENVASMDDESKNVMSKLLGCEPVFIDSADFSAQSRPRYYWCNFNVDTNYKLCDNVLGDILQTDVPEKYFYEEGFDYIGDDKVVCAILHINGHDILKRINNRSTKCQTLTTCGGGNTQKKVLENGKARKLTPLEYERLQTLPDNYTEGVADTWRYTTCGNGWTVDVIAHILKGIEN